MHGCRQLEQRRSSCRGIQLLDEFEFFCIPAKQHAGMTEVRLN
ncbi:MAG: hypothetical protein OEZ38_12630 [Gammaproteobacteria bacterium]|nr:hypothetical protein [Gammaproteobacteria bacterium]